MADDQRLFSEVIKNFLSQQARLQTVFEADAASLFTKLKTSQIDILAMEIITPGMNGVEMLKTIRNLYPGIKVIILSMSADLHLINELLDIGIYAYISKADEPENLLQAIRSVAEDKVYRNKLLTDALYLNRDENLKRNPKSENIFLNDREKKILQLLWEEKSNKDIANEIFLGVRSIEKIRQALKEKLGTKSTIGLIKYALNHKIIETDTKAVS